MGFNKRYVDKERLTESFARRGMLGIREFLGLEGLAKIDALIITDEFSDKVVTAYQEGRENDVAFDIADEVLKTIKLKEKSTTLNDFEKYCLDNKIDPYLQTK